MSSAGLQGVKPGIVSGKHNAERLRRAYDLACLRLRQTICGLQGHEAMLHLERNRVSLRCASCGFETPGWTLERG